MSVEVVVVVSSTLAAARSVLYQKRLVQGRSSKHAFLPPLDKIPNIEGTIPLPNGYRKWMVGDQFPWAGGNRQIARLREMEKPRLLRFKQHYSERVFEPRVEKKSNSLR